MKAAKYKIVLGFIGLWLAIPLGMPVGLTIANSYPQQPDETFVPAVLRAEDFKAHFDGLGRLVAFPHKTELPCPTQTERTAVLLVAGQSNAANHASSLSVSKHGGAVVNAFGGRCYIAQSPLLGASGEWGEPWTELGNRLIASGAYDTVVIIPAAIAGSTAALWTPKGRLHPIPTEAIRTSSYTITHAIWLQGESDFVTKTSENDYRNQLLDIVASLRTNGLRAPVYVTVATRCTPIAPDWRPNNVIAIVQRTLPSVDPTTRGGVDADNLLTSEDRYDDCHLSRSGVTKLSTAWLGILRDRHAGR